MWVRDPQEGFIIGKFTDMVDGDALIVPLDPKYPQRTCPLDEVYPAGEYTKDVEDNCNFPSTNVMFCLIFYLEKNIRPSYGYLLFVNLLQSGLLIKVDLDDISRRITKST